MKRLQVLRVYEAGLLESLELVRNRIAEIENRAGDAGEQPIDAGDDAAEPPVAPEVQHCQQTSFRPFYR